jgi:hypothetical protein
MGSKESLLRNKYKKTQPFQKSQLMFLSFNMLYIVINIYIYIYGIEGVEKRRRRRRRREKEKKRRELTPEGKGRWWWNAGGKCRREVEKVR